MGLRSSIILTTPHANTGSTAGSASGTRSSARFWSSTEARWTLEVEGPDGKQVTYTCNFLQMCSGYYDYDGGYMPGWPGMERFKGEIVHMA